MGNFFHQYADLSAWLGLLISTVGMLLTIWTLKTAKDIEARVLRRGRLPELLKSIENSLSELSELLIKDDFQSQALKTLIRRTSVTIKNAQKRVNGSELRKALIKSGLLLEKPNLTKNDGESFHEEMTAVYEELSLIKRDDEWSDLL